MDKKGSHQTINSPPKKVSKEHRENFLHWLLKRKRKKKNYSVHIWKVNTGKEIIKEKERILKILEIKGTYIFKKLKIKKKKWQEKVESNDFWGINIIMSFSVHYI